MVKWERQKLLFSNMGRTTSFDKVINEAWKQQEKGLAIRSASRIWVLASDIGSTLFFGTIFMIFSFAGMRTRYELTKENFFKSSKIESSMRIIEKQKHEVEEKQKEILDSIHYAKRIQNALITNEKYIDKTLNDLSN